MEHARLDDTSGVHLHTLQLSHNGDVGEERENDRSISLYCSANNEPASTTEAVDRATGITGAILPRKIVRKK